MIQSILSTALSVLPPQKFGWKKFLGSTTNEHGYEVDEYADEIEIFGLLQPVPRRLYEYQGLDFQKDFWNFYSIEDIEDIGVGGGDLLTFGGKTFKVESATKWTDYADYTAVLVVRIDAE